MKIPSCTTQQSVRKSTFKRVQQAWNTQKDKHGQDTHFKVRKHKRDVTENMKFQPLKTCCQWNVYSQVLYEIPRSALPKLFSVMDFRNFYSPRIFRNRPIDRCPIYSLFIFFNPVKLPKCLKCVLKLI